MLLFRDSIPGCCVSQGDTLGTFFLCYWYCPLPSHTCWWQFLITLLLPGIPYKTKWKTWSNWIIWFCSWQKAMQWSECLELGHFLTHWRELTQRVNDNSFSSQYTPRNPNIVTVCPFDFLGLDNQHVVVGSHCSGKLGCPAVASELLNEKPDLMVLWEELYQPSSVEHSIQGSYISSEVGCCCPVNAGYTRQR